MEDDLEVSHKAGIEILHASSDEALFEFLVENKNEQTVLVTDSRYFQLFYDKFQEFKTLNELSTVKSIFIFEQKM